MIVGDRHIDYSNSQMYRAYISNRLWALLLNNFYQKIDIKQNLLE